MSNTPKEKPIRHNPEGAQPAKNTPETANPNPEKPEEIGGPQGPEPTRYGDWERKGRCVDF